MEKQNKFKNETKELEKVLSSTFDDTAYSIVRLNDKWNLVSVSFNKNTGVGGQMEILESNNERFEIEERFKILIAEEVFQ